MTYDLAGGHCKAQGGNLSCHHRFLDDEMQSHVCHFMIFWLSWAWSGCFRFWESLCLKKSTLDAGLAFLLFFTIEDVRGLGVDMGLFR